MMLAAVASLLVADAAMRAQSDYAGLYVAHQMEMAGALELTRSGHFRYQLDYGAVSESAEGDWLVDGTAVRLTSDPMPREPDFVLIRDNPAPAGELYVAVENDGDSWSPLTVLVTAEGYEDPLLLYANEDGRVLVPGARRAISVKMLLPVYETGGEPVKLSADRGHRLLLKLEANDVGKAQLRGERLAIEGSSLILYRYDSKIIFQRVRETRSPPKLH